MKKLFVVFLLALLSSASSAQPSKFGSWSTGAMEANEGLYAGTINESGSILGQYCTSSNDSCYWIIKNDITCKQGSSYPAMMNSDEGAIPVEVYCYVIDGSPRLVFKDFDAIDGAIKSSKKIGIVMPLDNGNFRVTRFDLAGASQAITKMRKNFLSLRPKRVESPGKDSTI